MTMAALDMIIRSILILTILPLMVIFAYIFGEINDPLYDALNGRESLVALGWNGLPGTVLSWLSLGMMLMVIGLFVWHLAAPSQEENVHRRVR